MSKATKSEILAQALSPLFSEATRRLKDMDRYGVYYTHSWEQNNEKAQNILVIPKDERFDRLEFVGMWLDMLLDYSRETGWDLKGSLEVSALSKILGKLYDGEEV